MIKGLEHFEGVMYLHLWRLINPEKNRVSQQVYSRSEKGRASMRDRRARYNKSEKGRAAKVRIEAARNARKRTALVPGTEEVIKATYARAAWWRTQGFDVEVDHIFPLGFGWHEPANLQIIYASENRAKNCSFDYRPKVVFV